MTGGIAKNGSAGLGSEAFDQHSALYRAIMMSGLRQPVVGGVVLTMVTAGLFVAMTLLYMHHRSNLVVAWSQYQVKQLDHVEGHMYRHDTLDAFWRPMGRPSRVRLLEDGREMAAVNASADEIRQIGKGRYSLGNDGLLFSTSDNSDPRLNGRAYEVRGPRKLPVQMLLFGGFLLLVAAAWTVCFWMVHYPRVVPSWMPPSVAVCLILTVAALTSRGFVYGLIEYEPVQNTVGMRVMGVPYSDASGWDQEAEYLLKGNGLAPSWKARRPFYAIFLGTFYFWFGVSWRLAVAINLFLSVLTVPLVYLTVRRMVPDLVAFCVALLLIVHPDINYYSALLSTETLGLFLVVLSVALLFVGMETLRKWPLFFSGVMFGLSNLARPAIFLAWPVWATVLAWVVMKRTGRWRAMAMAATLVLGIAVAIGPWMVRQKLTYGFWSLSDNSAELFYAAASPQHGVWKPEVNLDVQNAGASGSIPDRYRFYTQGFRDNLKANPAFYIQNVAKSTVAAIIDLHRVINQGPGMLILLLALLVAYLTRLLRVSSVSSFFRLTVLVGGMMLMCAQMHRGLTVAMMGVGAVSLAMIQPVHALLLVSCSLCTAMMLGLMGGVAADRINMMTFWIAGILIVQGWLEIWRWGASMADPVRVGPDRIKSTRLPISWFPKPVVAAVHVAGQQSSLQRVALPSCLVLCTFFAIPSVVMVYRNYFDSRPIQFHQMVTGDDADQIKRRVLQMMPDQSPLVQLAQQDAQMAGLSVVHGTISRRLWHLPADQVFVDHWSQFLEYRSYDRTLFYIATRGYFMYGGVLPEHWAGRDVVVISQKNPTINSPGEGALNEVVAILASPNDENQPDWSDVLVDSHPQHLQLIADMISPKTTSVASP